MSQENVEIVRRGYQLFQAGDFEAVAALFSSGVELPDAGGLGIGDTGPGTRTGPEGFLRTTEETRDAFEDFRVEPEDFIDAGEVVPVPVRISGRGRASGVKQEARLAHVWALRNGKVIRNEIYRTVEEALEAAGLRGVAPGSGHVERVRGAYEAFNRGDSEGTAADPRAG